MVGVLALVGPLVYSPFAGVLPVWAAAQHKPAPAANPASAIAAPVLAWPSGDGSIPATLLVPVAHVPADLVAPSYAGWLTDPPHGALPGDKFVARGPGTVGAEVFQRVSALAPPAPPSSASVSPALVPAALPAALPASSAPLPPKRLAEKRGIVLASLAPLPPRRLAEPVSVAPPETAAREDAPPADAPAPSDNAVDAGTEVAPEEIPQEDAARSIDDAPEPAATRASADRAPPHIEALIQRHAERFDVPARLVRRVAWRESRFNHRLRHGPYWGLMQIRVDTARALGFRGEPNDLLDADTNMAYAVAYLANAYRVAGRDEKRAVMLYARGYYYEAKRKGMLGSLIRTATAEQ
ncbi:lytic transglycosylase domain-containing protein [Ancylobacter amanitiformis]|uniref:Soluble lytic murein transglycosylase-like protein n=1 Tax=Ancylobacter amanitiformis TaxID=217069 RepID=A0ABU0LMK0_9HYPH|nr:lytic transglycosylase domain-containing protein [Ancylobacter amanitiformis]MDQ0509911.1 soluble lytic murein transglycosylase-like protein [Ancylobacter amanitiformis]